MKVLVINAGSSSLKYQLINTDNNELLAKGLFERIGIEGGMLTHTTTGKEKMHWDIELENHAKAISVLIETLTNADYGVVSSMSEIDAVGHRVVHGGESFSGSVLITEAVMNALDECTELAPLHNPPNITGIKACEELMPGVPQVAVFDTAFHQTMPKEAYLYAIPMEYYDKYKIRRYGFHGTSHKFVSMRAAEMLGKPIEDLKIVTCHLGSGSSIAAVDGGKSVETSMGFTPLAGIAMGTRSGDIDPAIVDYLAQKEGISSADVINILNKKSGVLGVSGIGSDFRDLLENCKPENKEKAQVALDVFVHSVKKYIGAYAAIMGGIDVLVFTAGVGENTVYIREAVTESLGFMGIKIDKELNNVKGVERDISTPDATVKTLIIPTNEELMIALDTKKIVNK